MTDQSLNERVARIMPPENFMIRNGVAIQRVGLATFTEFDPEHSIADAWLVVERMREMRSYMDLVQLKDWNTENPGKWKCRFTGAAGLVGEYKTAPSAPRAICLAALEAVGEKDDSR